VLTNPSSKQHEDVLAGGSGSARSAGGSVGTWITDSELTGSAEGVRRADGDHGGTRALPRLGEGMAGSTASGVRTGSSVGGGSTPRGSALARRWSPWTEQVDPSSVSSGLDLPEKAVVLTHTSFTELAPPQPLSSARV